MSISVIDYTGDYVNREVLPNSPLILIICEEYCLVPDSVHAFLLPDLDYSIFSSSGIYILRIPNEFYRGFILGHIYSTLPSCKFYTSRPEIFSSFIPNSLVNWPMPYRLVTYRAAKIEKVALEVKSTFFEEIYEKSLNKLAKMYLLQRMSRSNKTKSFKSQLKNLIEGVVTSYKKKTGSIDHIDIDSLLEVLLSDLENHGILVCGMNINFNDEAIEEYFGRNKSKIFAPSYKKNKAKANGELNINEKKFSEACNSDLEQNEGGQLNKSSCLKKIENFAGFNNGATQREPENVNENSTVKKKFPLISTPIPISYLRTWEKDEPLVIEFAIKSVIEKIDLIDTCFKLFRSCNRSIRDFIFNSKLQVTESLVNETIKKALKIILDSYFISKSHPPDLVEHIEKYWQYQLHKKIN